MMHTRTFAPCPVTARRVLCLALLGVQIFFCQAALPSDMGGARPAASAENSLPPLTNHEHAFEEEAPSCPQDSPSGPLLLTGYEAVCVGKNLPEVQHIRNSWESVLARHEPERVYGDEITLLSAPVLKQWRNLAGGMPKFASDIKLRYINGFYNNWSSVKDIDNYKEDEYWATPEEFLDKGGDCEDYAIVKYFALRHFSWPAEDLWILLVERKKDGEKHAVLAARDKNRTFILDNLSRPAYLLIPEAAYMQNFVPLFAVNETGLWKFSGQGADQKNGERADQQTKKQAGKKTAEKQAAKSR